MAKKTAPKKKAAPVKAKAKTVSKPTKVAKPAKAVPVAKAKLAPAPVKKVEVIEKSKPALMTKKGKDQPVAKATMKPSLTIVEQVEVKKTKTVVSMLEDTPETTAVDIQKADKISKVKSVKVDRGNVNDEKAKWAELFKKYGKEKAFNYKMTETYPSLIPLQHKVLGWGFVLTNDNDRLEVLFENGIRMLISNYKS
jgi:hypothetical protein